LAWVQRLFYLGGIACDIGELGKGRDVLNLYAHGLPGAVVLDGDGDLGLVSHIHLALVKALVHP